MKMNKYILKCSTGLESDIIESEDPLSDSELFEEAQAFMHEKIEAWYEIIEGDIARNTDGDQL